MTSLRLRSENENAFLMTAMSLRSETIVFRRQTSFLITIGEFDI